MQPILPQTQHTELPHWLALKVPPKVVSTWVQKQSCFSLVLGTILGSVLRLKDQGVRGTHVARYSGMAPDGFREATWCLFWGHVGPSWRHPGPSWPLSWPVLALASPILDHVGPFLTLRHPLEASCVPMGTSMCCRQQVGNCASLVGNSWKLPTSFWKPLGAF